MAGYDQVDFSKVKQKGDFGYSESKGEIHIVTDEEQKLCSPLSTPKSTRS